MSNELLAFLILLVFLMASFLVGNWITPPEDETFEEVLTSFGVGIIFTLLAVIIVFLLFGITLLIVTSLQGV